MSGPPEPPYEEEAPNRPPGLWLKTVVLNGVGKGATRSCQVWAGKMSDGLKPSVVRSVENIIGGIKTGVYRLFRDESGSYPFTAQAVSGVQAA